MKQRFTILTLSVLTIVALVIVTLTAASPAIANGAEQISGIGYFAAPGECIDPRGEGAAYALIMTEGLEGCHYVFVETAVCSPSGAYVETGTELFIAKDSENDTFRTTYKFEAKYQDCANLVGEIFGRCQHPIVADSGTGIYEGVSGRLDMTDDIEAGNFPYRGHLRY